MLQANPEIGQHQWSIYQHLYEHESLLEKRELHKIWLAPYLSLEGFAIDPAKLFGLLHNRSKFSPEQWCAYENYQIQPGWQCGGVEVEHLRGCVIMHGPHYGELTEWDMDEAHCCNIIGFPRAKLILEAQQHILGFLRKVVGLILEGVDINTPGASDKWVAMTSLGFKQTQNIEYWSPYVNQPFSAPPVFDAGYLVSIVKTKLNDTGDNLWLMQTDPSYMRHFIKILSQGAVFESIPSRKEAMRRISADIIEEVWAHFGWQWVAEECENVQSHYTNFRDDIGPGKKLPETYDQALGALELLIVNRINDTAQRLLPFWAQRPGFRDRFTFDTSIPGKISIQPQVKPTTKELFKIDRLHWCLAQLLYAPQQHEIQNDYGLLFAILEDYLSKASSQERARMDQTLYDRVSSYATMTEIQQMVQLHRPLSTKRTLQDVRENGGHRKSCRHMRSIPHPNTDRESMTKALIEFNTLPMPTGKRDHFYMENAEQLRAALSVFWAEVRKDVRQCLELAEMAPEDIEMDLQTLSADTELEHIKAMEQEKQEILASIAKASEAKPKVKPVAVQTQWASTSAEKIVSSTRTKVKSRPETQQPTAGEEIFEEGEEANEEEVGAGLMIPAKQRTIDILSRMFPTNAGEIPSSKPIRWDDFVSAMTDVGFSARRGSGCEVIFEAEKREQGKIVFHKPHPVAKIDVIEFLHMGKRMRKWYGWGRDVFCLRDTKGKDAEEGSGEVELV